MTAPVMPAQHFIRYALCLTKPQNALHIACELRSFIVIHIIIGNRKEAGRRKLFTITNNNNLAGPGYGSQSINRLNLAGLINKQKIKADSARL